MNYATPADILNACAEYFGIPISTILGDTRAPDVIFARRAIAAIARQMTAASLPEIGRVASRTGSHSTVMQRCEAWRETPKPLRDSTERFVRAWLEARGVRPFDAPRVGGWQAVDFIRHMDAQAKQRGKCRWKEHHGDDQATGSGVGRRRVDGDDEHRESHHARRHAGAGH